MNPGGPERECGLAGDSAPGLAVGMACPKSGSAFQATDEGHQLLDFLILELVFERLHGLLSILAKAFLNGCESFFISERSLVSGIRQIPNFKLFTHLRLALAVVTVTDFAMF